MSVNSIDAEGLPASPRVSVCVPMYNNGETIERCLRSILDQDGNFEILIVDDNSSDDSVAVAATMLRAGDRLVRNESRLGAHDNHNKCLELARGSLIQYVHGDDWLLPGALQTLARCFDEPGVGLAFSPRQVVTDDLEWLRRHGTVHNRFRNLKAYNRGPSLVAQMAVWGMGTNWIGEPTCVMFRRQLALETGGVRNDIPHLADLELWLRLMLRCAVCFVPQELSGRRHSAFTADDMSTWTWWLDRLQILTWMIMDPASPTTVRILAGAWWMPVWLARALVVMIFLPDRWSRMKILLLAPLRQFAHARRLRKELRC
jgi:glycosyltransferase involved in cell wall biosynthesis